MSQLAVSGGAGSIDARTHDMRAQAAVLRTQVDTLTDLAAKVGAVAVDETVLSSGLFDPVGVARITGAVAAAQLPPSGLGWLVLEYDATAYFLVGAADAYDAADAALAEAATGLKALAGEAIITGVVALTVAAAAQIGLVGGTVLVAGGALFMKLPPDVQRAILESAPEWLDELAAQGIGALKAEGAQTLFDNPWIVDTLVAGLPAAVNSPGELFGAQQDPLTYEELVALVLAGGGAAGLFGAGTVTTKPVKTANAGTPDGVGDLFRRIESLYNTKENQQIRVTKVVGPDGELRFVVEIPGTEAWSPEAGANPSDLGTNLQTMAGIDSNVEEAVRQALNQAMEAAGVPDGEHGSPPVMLAGHSQGGIVAARLAAEGTFNVTDVVTAGSPVSRIALPDDVHLLALEHEQDVIPRLDGASNVSQSNVTTVSRDVESVIPVDQELGAQNVIDAHATGVYGETGSMIDTSDDPALAPVRDRLNSFFQSHGDSETYLYEAVQEPR